MAGGANLCEEDSYVFRQIFSVYLLLNSAHLFDNHRCNVSIDHGRVTSRKKFPYDKGVTTSV